MSENGRRLHNLQTEQPGRQAAKAKTPEQYKSVISININIDAGEDHWESVLVSVEVKGYVEAFF